jgi:predicted Rossmann fold flavoprotein
MNDQKKIAIIGGGAAGFFAAINIAQKHPDFDVTIYEKSNQLLGKVKVSGGGRCNVTHACFEPKELIKFYPRGGNELLNLFKSFQPKNTIDWFEKRGVKIKQEEDGRMFPITNKSQTIIDCFMSEAEKSGVKIETGMGLTSLEKVGEKWKLEFNKEKTELVDAVMIAAGSSEIIWDMMRELKHTIIPPVPSLFTFHIKDKRIDGLMGLSVPNAVVQMKNRDIKTNGPLLITHWGMSGPAVLKSSAWEAIFLNEKNYHTEVLINFTGKPKEEIRKQLSVLRDAEAKKLLGTFTQFGLPTRLWKQLCDGMNLSNRKWAGLGNKDLDLIATELCAGVYSINGKTTFKEEFVTCGGISLEEVNMKTMESKLHSGLFFGGEVLNIDAVTGGFNFQAAWTTGWTVSVNVGK